MMTILGFRGCWAFAVADINVGVVSATAANTRFHLAKVMVWFSFRLIAKALARIRRYEPRQNPAEYLTLRIFVGIDLGQCENSAPVEASKCAPMSETGQTQRSDALPTVSGLPRTADIICAARLSCQ
jgi:hypothetical protein